MKQRKPRIHNGTGFCSRYWIASFLGILLVVSGATAVGGQTDPFAFTLVGEGQYCLRSGDRRETALALAAYEAKLTAVDAAAKYFASRELIGDFGKKRKTIHALVADSLTTAPEEVRWHGQEVETVSVRVKLRIEPSNFIRAQLECLDMEKAAAAETWREEMEPSLTSELTPGRDIAKGYLLIHMGAIREAIIYLDRLQNKYPHWPEVFATKAMAAYLQQDLARMRDELRRACDLGHSESCDELKMMVPSH